MYPVKAGRITDHPTQDRQVGQFGPVVAHDQEQVTLDARRNDLERQLSATPAPDPIRIHPSMAKTYNARIGQLIVGLGDAERMDEAKEALRALIEKVELVQASAEGVGYSKPGLAIHLHGASASLLHLACGLPVHAVVGAAGQTQKPRKRRGVWYLSRSESAEADLQGIDSYG